MIRNQYCLLLLTALAIAAMTLSCGGEADQVDDSVSDPLVSDAVPQDPDPDPELPRPERDLQPGFIRARHILVSWEGSGVRGVTRTREEAEQLVQQLQDRLASGETFQQLAFLYSDCTTAPDSGMLPDFTREAMVQEFEDAAFSLDSGDVSGVVETDFGFHLIMRVR